jgi:hypothetical protein
VNRLRCVVAIGAGIAVLVIPTVWLATGLKNSSWVRVTVGVAILLACWYCGLETIYVGFSYLRRGRKHQKKKR